jgi:uncharacterized membrane protein
MGGDWWEKPLTWTLNILAVPFVVAWQIILFAGKFASAVGEWLFKKTVQVVGTIIFAVAISLLLAWMQRR